MAREIGHDRDGGAIYEDEFGERWNAGDDHECTPASHDSGREARND